MAVVFVERVHKVVWADYIASKAGFAKVAERHCQYVAQRWRTAVQFYRSDLEGAFRSSKISNSDLRSIGFMAWAAARKIQLTAAPPSHHERNHDVEGVFFRLESLTIHANPLADQMIVFPTSTGPPDIQT